MLIDRVINPWPVSASDPNWLVREESEVAVGHVTVLGAEQKASHDSALHVTVHDHYTHTIHTAVRSPQASTLFNKRNP